MLVLCEIDLSKTTVPIVASNTIAAIKYNFLSKRIIDHFTP